MSSEYDLVQQYPWLRSLEKYFSDIASKPPTEFISEIFTNEYGNEIKERLLKLFKAAFDNLEEIHDYKTDKLNLYVYLLLKIFLYALDNRVITNRLANLYSKITYNELITENSNLKIYNICKDLGFKINYYDPPINYGKKIIKEQTEKFETNFSIHFIDYLKLASNLRDEYRKLVHNSLSDGFVFIQNNRLIRLIQEYVRNKLLIEETKDKSSLNKFLEKAREIQDFKNLYEEILSKWAERKEEFEFKFNIDFEKSEDLQTLFPPCVKEILNKAQEGQNLIHNERLFIVWYLIALDYPTDKIVNIFSKMPDFDEETTTYQVNFAQRKKYIPYKCSTLKSLTLCRAEKYNDELCLIGYGAKEPSERKKLAHPLNYTRIKQYRTTKEKEFMNKKTEEENE